MSNNPKFDTIEVTTSLHFSDGTKSPTIDDAISALQSVKAKYGNLTFCEANNYITDKVNEIIIGHDLNNENGKLYCFFSYSEPPFNAYPHNEIPEEVYNHE